jgi:hypothetical protein
MLCKIVVQLRNSHDNILPEHIMMAVTTKDLEVRKTNLLTTQRPESLKTYIKDSHPKTEASKDHLYKDIGSEMPSPETKTPKITLMFSFGTVLVNLSYPILMCGG